MGQVLREDAVAQDKLCGDKLTRQLVEANTGRQIPKPAPVSSAQPVNLYHVSHGKNNSTQPSHRTNHNQQQIVIPHQKARPAIRPSRVHLFTRFSRRVEAMPLSHHFPATGPVNQTSRSQMLPKITQRESYHPQTMSRLASRLSMRLPQRRNKTTALLEKTTKARKKKNPQPLYVNVA
ncbi:hypothetical protein OCU04_006075 [Sclerotinia nivalis]|uniref:Uncharacterized protein n=1 Tax=Sclerotinia nivalis TaxID=352851 RepID=A0A9X0DJ14_9HELO|nr:hypothetical protein OCU04_006075 [Sclerotinia nivalis]